MKEINEAGKIIFVCDGKKCGKYSKEIRKCFRDIIKENGLKKEIDIIKMDCSDNCEYAPVISLQPQNIWLGWVTKKDIPLLLDKYLK